MRSRIAAIVAGFVVGAVPGVALAGDLQTGLSSAVTEAQSLAFSWVAESWPLLAVFVAVAVFAAFVAIVRGS